MRLLSRTIFREVFSSALLGCVLFTSVLFLQFSKPLFEFLVRNSGPPRTVAYLFFLVLPQALPFAIPLGVLVGTLITLSRMSADGEIIALRAAGISGRRVAPPIIIYAFLAMAVTAAASLWLTPWSIRERYRVLNELIAGGLTANVQPRVFVEEQFPNTILYIGDVTPGSVTRWRRIFLADTTPPDKRVQGVSDQGDSPVVTLASDALAVPDVPNNRIHLAMRNANTYIAGKQPKDYTVTGSPNNEKALQSKPTERQVSRPAVEMDTLPLYRLAYKSKDQDRRLILDSRIELHQRLALPIACVLLALAGIPLGVGTRRTGKSGAVVMTVVIALSYYMGLIGLISLASQGKLSPAVAVWLPNAVFSIFGLAMLIRLEAPGERDLIGHVTGLFRSIRRSSQERMSRGLGRAVGNMEPRVRLSRFPVLVHVVDTYVLSGFVFYFILLLLSFVMMYQMFEFFRLLSDTIKNNIAFARILSYHLFLTPRLVYYFAPAAVMASVLVVFGVFSKNNEVTAFKASGISAYRLAAPVLLVSLLLSGSLFAFDHYWVPEFDRRQDQIYNEIKGRPPQTYLQAGRTWFYGLQDRVYNYRYIDPVDRVMVGVNIYEIDPDRFRLKRHISAQRARWAPGLNKWVFENGWSSDLDGNYVRKFDPFPDGARTFSELQETPDYFLKEAKQSVQMNYLELQAYIDELKRSGFDTTPLQVQFHKKFSKPVFALILALVSIPFAFMAGNRGAMTGVGISFAIFILYWSTDQVSEQVGNLGQLSAVVAAWSPDVIFSLAGLYFLTRIRT